RPDSTYSAWTFDMRDLVTYWNEHGDTGAALIPIAPNPSDSFAVAFYANRAQAVATDVPVAGSGTSSSSPPQVPGSTAAAGPSFAGPPTPDTSGGGMASPVIGTGPGASAITPTSSPALSPQTPATAPTGPAASTTPQSPARRGGSSPAWPWVLAGSLIVALAVLGIANRESLVPLFQRVFPPAAAAFRAHPRAHTIAAVAAIWGLVFTGYSLAIHPSGINSQAVASAPSRRTASPVPSGGATPSGPGTVGQTLGGQSVGSQSGTVGADKITAGASTGTGATSPAANEFASPGTYRTIDGVKVLFPANGGPPVADLYQGSDDTVGMSSSSIKLCMHAALTYGSAFNINASDLNVYWEWLNAHGGIYGRTVDATYQNDNYDPGTAVQAAQACKDWGTFLLLSGIGFDQIPAVRQWAEQNHELYLYATATSQGTQGLRYSFSAQPSVEQVGTAMGQLAVQQFRGKKVGIIYRNSSNWEPGVTTFKQELSAAGMQVVGSYPVTINQGDYTNEIVQLEAKGAQVVFAWENALADTEIIKQAQGQNYHPAWLLAAFNIMTNTLGSSSLDQQLWSAQPWDAYDPGYYGGGFTSTAGYIQEFEAEYKQYDPSANLSGDGGDLLYQTWEGERQVADMLKVCGPSCTRNKLAGLLLAGYHDTVPPNCPVNFNSPADHHHGGYLFDVLHVIKDPNGRPNFVPLQRCVAQIG
ncbi:MAG: ABC transporter substrate-binding protein, partial [Acidimicrobiales bacterium]